MPIAVLGMGCRLPGGVEGPDDFWRLLVEGREVIEEIPPERWDLQRHHDPDPRRPLRQHVRRAGLVQDIDQFDPALFGISGREAQCMDPQQRMLLEVCWRAMEAGAHSLERLRGRPVGVFMGISSADYSALLWASDAQYLTPDNEPFILTGNTGCIAANRISYAFDLKGPSFTVDTACSSSLVAVHLACESLRRGESELALAGGVQALIHPGIQMSFCKAGLLSPTGRCRSFDVDADGYVRSEGAGAVLLKPLAAALRDGDPIDAVIRGTAVNSDGRSQGLAAPSQRAQMACVQAAYDAAGLSPTCAQYVEAHGTGTRQGDPIELRALGAVLGAGRSAEQPCLVGSVKTNLGHSETAAGITGLIKTVLCLKHRQLPASLHYSRSAPSLDLTSLGLAVNTALRPWPELETNQEPVASVSSFGFGGTNAHAVLSSALGLERAVGASLSPPAETGLHLLWLSARSDQALERLREETAAWLEAHPEVGLQDLCATTHLGRSCFHHAAAFVVPTRSALLRQLRGQDAAAWCGTVPSRTSMSLAPVLMGLTQQTLPPGGVGHALLEQLVQALAAGAGMDWARWHQGASWCWVPSPGHPFLRSRFWWMPKQQAEPDAKASLWLEHLGVMRSQQVASLEASSRLQRLDLPGAAEHWQLKLDPSAVPDLADHALCGQPLLAAAGYLALVLDWLKDSQHPLQLGAFQLERPLWLQGGAVQLQLVLEGNQFGFHSQLLDGGSASGWQAHGQLQLSADAEPCQVMAPVMPDDLVVVEADDLYRALQQLGLDYGRMYQPLVEIRANAWEAEALLQRQEGAPDRCLIDGCFQLVAAVLAQGDSAGQLLLPVGVETVQFQRWPLPDRLRCVVRLRPQGVDQSDEGLGHVVADLDLDDLSGAPIGSIRGLQLRRMTRTLLELMLPVAPALPAARLLEESWKPLPGGALADWSASAAECISLLAVGELPAVVQSWCRQQAIAPVCFNVTDDPNQLLPALVDQLQAWPLVQPRHVLVLLPAAPHAAVGVIRAAVRAVAQDCPAWRCSTLTLAGEELTADQWHKLLAATAADAELRWCGDDRVERRQFVSIDRERFRLLSDGSGRLEGLVQVPLPMARLQPGELELAVEATGLNFRDVLNALGLLQSHHQSLGLRPDAQLPFGGEAVGRVVAVGPGVDPALVGTRMLAALTLGSLASHVRCRAALCVPWPESLSAELGASLSTAYLTAEYGLEHLAQLQAGEMVLIHAAAGGVGQAAVQVALRCGARILATASAAKQAALLEQGVEAVFDSRSTAFADQVLAHTDGDGVQVVLNSLKGEWVDASFRSLAAGGRFVELGKLEIWSDQQVEERRPDVRYHRFDLLEVAARDPQPLRERLLALVDAAQAQRLPALPTTVFPLDQVKDAFRRMAQGRHVGKLVVTLPKQASPRGIRGDATYLILGAFGGIGQRLQGWLVEQGARSLLLVGRQRPEAGSVGALQVEAWQARGIAAAALGWDDLAHALSSLPADRPLRGVFHAAGRLRDQRIGAITPTELDQVLAAKWGAQQQLASLLQQGAGDWCQLDFQVLFSSIAAGLGSPGQLAYAAANAALEASCRSATTEGPMQLAIQWGPWAGAGMAAGLERRFDAVGLIPLDEGEAFAALARLLQRGCSGVVTVMAADWSRLVSQALPRQAGWFQSLLPEASGRSEAQLRAQMQALPPDQRRPWLLATLQALLAEVMEQPDVRLDVHTNLFDLGLDSLMAAEFAAVVQESLGWRLDLAALSDAPCLDDLACLALERLLPDDPGSVPTGLDLAQESQLPDGWALPPVAASVAPGDRVLLTGASGFLGAYLLAGQLTRWPELQVRCLVRAASRDQGLERLELNLRRYGLWQPAWAQRLEVSLGDLSQPRLGLDADQFQALGHGVGGILHNGAQLSQMASYAQLAAANVGGTRELLRLAVADAPLRFELISSVAVFEADSCRDQLIDEHDALEAWQGIHLGYSQTKWVTDRMVRRAADQGLSVTVYRPPLIAGPSCGSAWHQGDLLQRLLQGCLALGASPDLAWELDVVPVDYVADAVTALAWSEVAQGRCFHLQHPEPLLLTTLLGQITAADEDWRVVPMQAWIDEIAQQSTNPLYPLLPFFRQGWGHDGLTYPERNCRGVRARPRCQETTHQLAVLGVSCPGWDQLIGPWASVLLQQKSMAAL